MKADKKSKACVICRNEFYGFGNNAEPIAKGQCCDKCNRTIVIPKRLQTKKDIEIVNIVKNSNISGKDIEIVDNTEIELKSKINRVVEIKRLKKVLIKELIFSAYWDNYVVSKDTSFDDEKLKQLESKAYILRKSEFGLNVYICKNNFSALLFNDMLFLKSIDTMFFLNNASKIIELFLTSDKTKQDIKDKIYKLFELNLEFDGYYYRYEVYTKILKYLLSSHKFEFELFLKSYFRKLSTLDFIDFKGREND